MKKLFALLTVFLFASFSFNLMAQETDEVDIDEEFTSTESKHTYYQTDNSFFYDLESGFGGFTSTGMITASSVYSFTNLGWGYRFYFDTEGIYEPGIKLSLTKLGVGVPLDPTNGGLVLNYTIGGLGYINSIRLKNDNHLEANVNALLGGILVTDPFLPTIGYEIHTEFQYHFINFYAGVFYNHAGFIGVSRNYAGINIGIQY